MGADVAFESIWKTPAWLLVFFNNMFFGCAGFSIVLPTIWPYLREMHSSTTFLAFVIATYSVGEGLGGWVIGQIFVRYPRHSKLLLQGGMFVGFLAALAYTAAPILGDDTARLVVLVARFFSGVDNGGRQTIEQTLVGTFVPPAQQTTISSRLGSFAITGVMLGPAFGAPLQAISFRVPGLGLMVDGNNGPGLVLCLVTVMNMIVTSLFFHPQALAQMGHSGLGGGDHGAPAAISAPPPNRVGLLSCYAVFFCVNLNMASLETVTPVAAQRLFGWGPCFDPASCPFDVAQTYVNLLLTCGGMLSLAMSLLMALVLGRLVYGRELAAITFGLLVSMFTNVSNIDFFGELPAWRFAANYLLGAFFGGLMRGPNISLLVQLIGPYPKASYMGVLFAVGAVPRVIGPFVFVWLLDLPPPVRIADYPDVYTGPVPRTWLLYGSQACLFALMVLLLRLAGPSMRGHLAALQAHAVQLAGTSAVAGASSVPLLGKPVQRATSQQVLLLPATPTGVREGLGDLSLVLRRAVTAHL